MIKIQRNFKRCSKNGVKQDAEAMNRLANHIIKNHKKSKFTGFTIKRICSYKLYIRYTFDKRKMIQTQSGSKYLQDLS